MLVRNLSIEGRRKKTGTLAYQKINPELISLPEVLDHLKLDLDQLIVLAIMVGTDYNPGGVKNIGPKKGLKLLKEYGNDFNALFAKVEWQKQYPDLTWQEVFDTIKNMPVTDNYKLEWKKIDEHKLLRLLVEEHNFSEERVRTKLEKLKESQKEMAQKGLKSFFG